MNMYKRLRDTFGFIKIHPILKFNWQCFFVKQTMFKLYTEIEREKYKNTFSSH